MYFLPQKSHETKESAHMSFLEYREHGCDLEHCAIQPKPVHCISCSFVSDS